MTTKVPTLKLDIELGKKLLKVIDAGLVNGVGKPIPGKMCVEAAICFALGEKHGDEPSCVFKGFRDNKISLNDQPWANNMERAAAMRKLAIYQLGSKGKIRSSSFDALLGKRIYQVLIPEFVEKTHEWSGKPIDPDHQELLKRLRTVKTITPEIRDLVRICWFFYPNISFYSTLNNIANSCFHFRKGTVKQRQTEVLLMAVKMLEGIMEDMKSPGVALWKKMEKAKLT